MALVSSAQNQEDIMLWRALRHVTEGFYIDVGAADPVEYSVTRVFYDQGWHGINLEPHLSYHTALSKSRSRDINLPIAAGREAGHSVFHDVEDSGLSTFDPEIAEQHREAGWTVSERTVETETLAEICRRYRPEGPIHFLKVDVEGSELDVLAGADFAAFRPWIVVVEATLPGSPLESGHEWEALLTEHGYGFVWFDGLHRFYLADEMKPSLEKHFQAPPNVFDGFEPAANLLQRAERAEKTVLDLTESLASARQGLEETRVALTSTGADLADTAERHAAASQALEETRSALASVRADLAVATEQHVAASRTLEEIRSALGSAYADLAAVTERYAATCQTLDETRSALGSAKQRATRAEAEIADLLASTSWRITAPIRSIRRLASSRDSKHSLPSLKQIGRSIFYRATRRALSVPGGRSASHYIYRLAPMPVDWLARRYRAYDGRPDEDVNPPVLLATEVLLPPGAVLPVELPELSEGEERLYRQIVSFGAIRGPFGLH